MKREELRAGLVGLAAGVLVTVGGAALVWPHGGSGADGVSVDVPTVPDRSSTSPAPTDDPTSTDSPSDSESPSDDSSASSSDSSSDGGDDSHDQPSDAPLIADAAPAGQGRLPDTTKVTCPAATTEVSDADELTEALKGAKPGDSIRLADGTYDGYFTATTSGTTTAPIFLCGSSGAVLDGGSTEDSGYVLHLDHASYWRLVGFTVTDGQKGVMTDGTVGSVISGLTVKDIGDEGIHLRDNSTDNVVADNAISDTGRRKDKYGEGIYVGSAVSNWCSYTECQADRSDRNVISHNTITAVTGEAVDVKEGTTGGVLVGNTFDGSDITGADSWVDIKGNNWLIDDNRGTAAPEDGFQTHEILDGWGDHNLFTANTGAVDGPGYGIALTPVLANRVACDNHFTGAGQGSLNVPCS